MLFYVRSTIIVKQLEVQSLKQKERQPGATTPPKPFGIHANLDIQGFFRLTPKGINLARFSDGAFTQPECAEITHTAVYFPFGDFSGQDGYTLLRQSKKKPTPAPDLSTLNL